MLVLVGPSASGKSAIVKCLESKYGIKKFITCTTRPMRVGEVNGVDYYFMTKEEFTTRYENDEFIAVVQDVKLNGRTVFDGKTANIRAEVPSNKVTTIDENSTDEEYPSAKCVYDIVGNIEEALEEV